MPKVPKREILRIAAVALVLVLVYILWGTLTYPRWWYGVLYEGGYKSLSVHLDGLIYIIRLYHLAILQTIIIVLAVLAFSGTDVPRKLSTGVSHLWRRGLLSWTSFFIGIALILAIVVSALKLESRTREEREEQREHEKTMSELRQNLAKYDDQNSEKLPLSVPTSFIYLDRDSTESLFGQYEPELVPAIVQEEIERSTNISAGIQSFISTDAGQTELNKRITEYRSIPKNSERKLKDLVRFLKERNLLPMFRDIEPKSEELNKLDAATKLLSQKYGLTSDSQQLHVVRDRLLAEELLVVENQLRDLRGLTFVEGEWSVEIKPNEYIFRRPFVEKISNAPMCEVKVNKTGINSKYRDVIENAKTKTLRLSIFGSVLVGLSESSRIVSITPTAIF